MDKFITILIFAVALANFFGYYTWKIMRGKGYTENWYWWGFFFGLPALIVAVNKPEAPVEDKKPSWNNIRRAASLPDQDKDRDFDYWKCVCMRRNFKYTNTCACGRTRQEASALIQKRFESSQAKKLEEAKVKSSPVTPVLVQTREDIEPEILEKKESPVIQKQSVEFESTVGPVPQSKPESVPQSKSEPATDSRESPKPMLTKAEINILLNQAQQLETAGEIYSFLRDRRDGVRTQEFDSLLQELRNCTDVERAYGNSKSTAIIHIDLYRSNTAMQTEAPLFG